MIPFPWSAWLIALCRPPRLDDEEVPVDLVPWWHWRRHLRAVYVAEVEHVTPRATQHATDFARFDDGPAPTDGCRYLGADGQPACNGCCARVGSGA